MEKTVINVDGMSCNHCVQAITKALAALSGIVSSEISLESGTVTVEYDPGITDINKIAGEINNQGYDVLP